MKKPLAFRLRPKTLDEVIGQRHLIGEGCVLRKCVEANQLFSMIFFWTSRYWKNDTSHCLSK